MVPPLRILHIEDNPVDARLLEDALTGAGHRVVARLVSCESELQEALAYE
jgi:CheY-like chemotaxis protein